MYTIKNSNIHGKGVFSSRKIPKNKHIGIAIRMILLGNFPHITNGFGNMINHSYKPNCRVYYKKTDGNYWIIANKNIPKDTELTVDYKYAPWFIAGPGGDYI